MKEIIKIIGELKELRELELKQMRIIGNNIYEYCHRPETRIFNSELSAAAHCSEKHISKVINGECLPNLIMFFYMCLYAKIPLKELLKGTDFEDLL